MAGDKTDKKLINTQYPYLKIYIPELKEYRQFEGGLLELSADDPAYDFLLERAKGDPNTAIHSAKAKLSAEGEPQSTELKTSGGAFICDVCSPPQAFGSQESLAEHNLELHTTKVEVNDAGEVKGAAKPRAEVRKGTTKTSK